MPAVRSRPAACSGGGFCPWTPCPTPFQARCAAARRRARGREGAGGRAAEGAHSAPRAAIAGPLEPASAHGAAAPADAPLLVRFDGVALAYDPAGENAVEDVTLAIREGEFVA